MKKMTNWVLAATLVIICGASVLTSCSNDNAPAGQQDEYKGVPLVIYDTDIGSSTDDLFALEMLYRYEDEGRCRLLGVMVDREGRHLASWQANGSSFLGSVCGYYHMGTDRRAGREEGL